MKEGTMSDSNEQISVVVAAPHPYIRAGLRSIIAAEPDFTVVGVAADGAALRALVEHHTPHVLVADDTLPDLAGPAILGAIHGLVVSTHAVILSRSNALADCRALLEAGARGILPPDHQVSDLLTAIRLVAAGRVALAPELVAALAHAHSPAPRNDHPALTQRERETLTLIAQGYS